MARIQTSAAGARYASAPLHLVYSGAETAVPAYYVFGAGNGFILAAADDLATPVLGYSDNGTFDYDKIPDQMREWLKGYAQEIEHARSLPAADASKIVNASRPTRQPIAPLVKTRWNQGDPYNALCPVYDGEKTVTGCVATAMAQVLRFWKYPAKGTGSHSYTYNGITHTFDFGNTTFDWDNMVHFYTGNTTQDQNDAVATLMRACGVAVDMMYNKSSQGGSGAYSRDVAPALVKYFNYAPCAVYYSRGSFGLYEWEDLIYGALKNGPVYYSGQGSGGGHAFVCDGYEGDGYFHFNWGWAGSSDGYFLLTALNPTTLGIGGGGGGFNLSQGAIIDLKPNFNGAKARYVIAYDSPYTITYSAGRLTLTGFGGNIGIVNIPNVRYGMRLKGANGQTYDFNGNVSNTSLRPNYGYNSFYANITLTSVANGTYDIVPIYKITENGTTTTYEALIPASVRGKFTLVKSGTTASLSTRSDENIVVNNFALTTPLYSGNNFGFKGDYVNTSDVEAYREVYMGWFSASDQFLGVGDAMMTNMQGGENKHVEMAISVPSKVKYNSSTTNSISVGTTYKLAMLVKTNNDNSAPSYRVISDKVTATVENASGTVKLTRKSLTVENASSVDAGNIKFKLQVTASGSYYTEPIYFWVKDAAGKYPLNGKTDVVTVAPGETRIIEWRFPFDAADKNARYTLLLNYRSGGKNVYLGETSFTVGTVGVNQISLDGDGYAIAPQGDNAMVSAPAAITSVEVYNLQGIRQNATASLGGETGTLDLTALSSGIYIVRITTTQGAATLKFMK